MIRYLIHREMIYSFAYQYQSGSIDHSWNKKNIFLILSFYEVWFVKSINRFWVWWSFDYTTLSRTCFTVSRFSPQPELSSNFTKYNFPALPFNCAIYMTVPYTVCPPSTHLMRLFRYASGFFCFFFFFVFFLFALLSIIVFDCCCIGMSPWVSLTVVGSSALDSSD